MEDVLTDRFAVLRTRNRVSATTSTSMTTEPEKLQEERSGLSLMSYRLGTANLGSRGWPLNCSIAGVGRDDSVRRVGRERARSTGIYKDGRPQNDAVSLMTLIPRNPSQRLFFFLLF